MSSESVHSGNQPFFKSPDSKQQYNAPLSQPPSRPFGSPSPRPNFAPQFSPNPSEPIPSPGTKPLGSFPPSITPLTRNVSLPKGPSVPPPGYPPNQTLTSLGSVPPPHLVTRSTSTPNPSFNPPGRPVQPPQPPLSTPVDASSSVSHPQPNFAAVSSQTRAFSGPNRVGSVNTPVPPFQTHQINQRPSSPSFPQQQQQHQQQHQHQQHNQQQQQHYQQQYHQQQHPQIAPGFPHQVTQPPLPYQTQPNPQLQSQPPPFSAPTPPPTHPPAYTPVSTYSAVPQPPVTNLPASYGNANHGQNMPQLIEDFQSLSMSSGPGQPEGYTDPTTLPRPITTSPVPRPMVPTNASSRFVQLTCDVMPHSQSLKSRWHLPLGAVIHPLAETPPDEEVPLVNFGTCGIVRCRRCRTYINPYVIFTDGGRRWRCNVCSLLNEVPVEYFCPLDANGQRRDIMDRPELRLGSVEFEAPAEYMVRPPMPPVFFFLIDVSMAAAQSGVLQIISETIKSCLDSLPGDVRTKVGFLTFDSCLHFYNLKSTLTQPQMMVVNEVNDPFLPLPDDLIVNLQESRTVVDSFLDSLPSMFSNNSNIESALGSAVKATYMLMSPLGGKVLLFQSTLPSLGLGRLKLRGQDSRTYGSDREHTLRVTEDVFYKNSAAECSRVQICIDMFTFADKYADLASIGTLSKYTGGQVYYYPAFQVTRDGEKLSHDLTRNLTRLTAWEAVMRIRCGKGLKISTFHGHFFVRSIDLLALPAVDCDKAFAVQISHDETILATPTVYFQCALLYTSSSGVRRIRVHTVAAPVVADLAQMYRSANCEATSTLLAKIALERTLSSRLEDARQMIQQKCAQTLREYKSLYASTHRLTGRMIFPPTLSLLPLYCLSLCKTTALMGGFQEVSPDQRSAAMYDLMNMSVERTMKLLYPSLYSLHTLSNTVSEKNDSDSNFAPPPSLPLSEAFIETRGAYLVDNGTKLMLWFGNAVDPNFVKQLFGLDALQNLDISQAKLMDQKNETSRKVLRLLDFCKQSNGGSYSQTYCFVQGGLGEYSFFSSLIEDRNLGGMSYLEFLNHIYRQSQLK